ncbi:hypothetical protein P9112_010028 [Eukaryota sp. TZLM1-RC]
MSDTDKRVVQQRVLNWSAVGDSNPTQQEGSKSSSDDSSSESDSSAEQVISSPVSTRDELLRKSLSSLINHFGVRVVLGTVGELVDAGPRRCSSRRAPPARVSSTLSSSRLEPVTDETSVPIASKRVHWSPQESRNLWILWKNTDPNPVRRNNWKRILDTGNRFRAFRPDRNSGKLKDRLRWLQENPLYRKQHNFPEDDDEDQ